MNLWEHGGTICSLDMIGNVGNKSKEGEAWMRTGVLAMDRRVDGYMSGWIQGWIDGHVESWRSENMDMVMDGWPDDTGEAQYVGPRLDGDRRHTGIDDGWVGESMD